jgi:hypothetical protein
MKQQLERYRRQRHAQPIPRLRLRRSFPGQEIILDLLDKADAARERQRLIAMDLADVLATGLDPDNDEALPVNVAGLQKGWNAFVASGGVSAADLQAFLRGEVIGHAVRTKRHLRLVRNNPEEQVIRRRRRPQGPDAAA